jgi:hypothetical protein
MAFMVSPEMDLLEEVNMADYFYATSTFPNSYIGGWNDYNSVNNTLGSTQGVNGTVPRLYAYTVTATSSGVYTVIGGVPSTTGPSYVVLTNNGNYNNGDPIDLNVSSDGAGGAYIGEDPTYNTPIIDTSATNGINLSGFSASKLTIGASATPDGVQPTAGTFCFLAGTHISTPTGEILVEDLNIGDIISTADGGVRKVIWIGKQTLSSIFTPAKNLPVEITIGALGNNLPTRPLRVSPGHSLLVGGVFPIASALINDITVRQLIKEELPDTFTYYHIEVEDHALILAEGVPAETFLDAWSRKAFSNWNEYVELYGEDEREVPRSELHYQRILKFDNLPDELKDTIGYPLSHDEMKVA